jgi:hypothetical protein
MRSDSAYFLLLISLLGALMMIEMNGPDIVAVDEVKTQILASRRGCFQGEVKGPMHPEAPTGRGMFARNSRDLRMRFSMISSGRFQ